MIFVFSARDVVITINYIRDFKQRQRAKQSKAVRRSARAFEVLVDFFLPSSTKQ